MTCPDCKRPRKGADGYYRVDRSTGATRWVPVEVPNRCAEQGSADCLRAQLAALRARLDEVTRERDEARAEIQCVERTHITLDAHCEACEALEEERDAARADVATLTMQLNGALWDGERRARDLMTEAQRFLAERDEARGEIATLLATADATQAAATQAIRERDAAEARAERLRQDRADALNVRSREGLISSEWIARTGKAERERDEADARARAAEERADQLAAALADSEFCRQGGRR